LAYRGSTLVRRNTLELDIKKGVWILVRMFHTATSMIAPLRSVLRVGMAIGNTAVRFLFGQNKWLVRGALLFSHIIVLADIETGIRSPRVTMGRLFLGAIVTELVALLIILPGLLFSFRLVARFASLLGNLRAVLVTGAVMFCTSALSRSSIAGPFVAPDFAMDIILCALIGGLLLFVIKGKNPFFRPGFARVPPEVPRNVKDGG
jgi:hypothetical protein